MFFIVLFWCIPFILSFGCVSIFNREMKCQCYFIYDKANSDVAILEWIGDAFNDDANFRISVKLKRK